MSAATQRHKSWLRNNTEYRSDERKRYYRNRKFGNPRAWTIDEDEKLRDEALSDTELAMMLKRSVQAVQTRRWKQKAGYTH